MDSINNGPKFGGDAWLELQAFKTRQINRREKLKRHKDLINEITCQNNNSHSSQSIPNSSKSQISEYSINLTKVQHHQVADKKIPEQALNSRQYNNSTWNNDCERLNQRGQLPPSREGARTDTSITDECRRLVSPETVECLLLLKLCDVALKLPIDSKSLQRFICKVRGCEYTSQATIENLLEKFAHQELITIEQPSLSLDRHRNQRIGDRDDDVCTYVISADHTKLVDFDRAFGSTDDIRALLLEAKNDDLNATDEAELVALHNSVPMQNIRRSDESSKQQEDSPIASTDHVDTRKRQSDGNCLHDKQIRQARGRISSSSNKNIITTSDDVESLLSLSSTRERESKKLGEELLELLSKPTAKERNLLESFRSADGYQVQEFCPKGTKDECRRNNNRTQACDKLHFKKIIAKHTEESLGDCSFLNTCFHMDSCKYVHYEVDYDSNATKRHEKSKKLTTAASTHRSARIHAPPLESAPVKSTSVLSNQSSLVKIDSVDVIDGKTANPKSHAPSEMTAVSTITTQKSDISTEEQARIEMRNRKRYKTILYPPQWIQCDLRYFDMSLLGKFSVVMADPPWDIHMELPYGTMSDDEMRKLNVPALQDDGVIFLWVTGRAMELGRECLALWGYERCDEIIWVKTNQLQRIIRTGRTGHWLNHGKEHCLVGIKGNPVGINRGLDCDIIVAEVRATSHKPDEIYGIIERLSPGTRKIELFGRAHNVQPNWITLGNQLDGVRLVEPNLIEAFKELNLPYQVGELAP